MLQKSQIISKGKFANNAGAATWIWHIEDDFQSPSSGLAKDENTLKYTEKKTGNGVENIVHRTIANDRKKKD